jgi:predicted nicotinamide N-methyase
MTRIERKENDVTSAKPVELLWNDSGRRNIPKRRLEQKAAEQKDAQDDHDGNDYDFNQGHLGNLS